MAVLFILASLLLFGCTEQIPGIPFTTSQLISHSTDLNYTKFANGDYNGLCLTVDGNKLTASSCSGLAASDLNQLTTAGFAPFNVLFVKPSGGVGQDGNFYFVSTTDTLHTNCINLLDGNTFCAKTDFPGGNFVDTNTVTAGWTTGAGVWEIDLNTTKQVNTTGTGNNYFVGNTGVGTLNPVTKLDVNGNEIVRGDINVTGDFYGNQIYGHLDAEDVSATIVVGTAFTYYDFNTNLTGGLMNGVVFDENKFKILVSGVYQLSGGLTLNTTVNNQVIEGALGVNGVHDNGSGSMAEVINGNKPVTVTVGDTIRLNAGDHVGFMVENETAANNIIAQHAWLNIVRVGN